jgi:mannose-6-phosphate isomerase
VDPIVLASNQIPRFYRGGEAIAGFRGVPHRDEFAPEDWVGSATAVFGSETLGLSTLPDGRTVKEALRSDPEGFLGPAHAERFGSEMGLLVKLLDAGQRLPVHCHPSREFARRHLDCPYGKTEAWVVVEVRSPEPNVSLGFRDDVDLATLTGWVTGQDTEAIAGAMHRLPAAVGDSILVPAGVPHSTASERESSSWSSRSRPTSRCSWSGKASISMELAMDTSGWASRPRWGAWIDRAGDGRSSGGSGPYARTVNPGGPGWSSCFPRRPTPSSGPSGSVRVAPPRSRPVCRSSW